MNNILSEKEYQHFIMERLEKDNGFIVRNNSYFDRYFAIDKEMLFSFLYSSQPDEMAGLNVEQFHKKRSRVC